VIGLSLALLISSGRIARQQNLAWSGPRQWIGGDVSEIPEEEADGAKYFNLKGVATDPFKLMKQAGWTAVRFRVWVNPPDGYCDEVHTLAVAKRAAAAGLKVLVDFHYSDGWADPNRQITPAKWANLTFPALVKKVHDYTFHVVSDLVNQGTPPAGVQIGNEITVGFCWPKGRLVYGDPSSWTRLGKLVKAGISAVHEVKSPTSIATIIHIDRGGDNIGARDFVDHLTAEGVRFDVLGLSYYPWWHGHIDALKQNLDDLSKRYSFKILIAETAYPWEITPNVSGSELFNDPTKLEIGYPASPEGQKQFLNTIEAITRSVPNTVGILYWAPCWIKTPGHPHGYDNLCLFDRNGSPLPGFFKIGK